MATTGSCKCMNERFCSHFGPGFLSWGLMRGIFYVCLDMVILVGLCIMTVNGRRGEVGQYTPERSSGATSATFHQIPVQHSRSRFKTLTMGNTTRDPMRGPTEEVHAMTNVAEAKAEGRNSERNHERSWNDRRRKRSSVGKRTASELMRQ